MANADPGPWKALYRFAFSEQAVVRWGILGLVGLGLRGLALWTEVSWLDRLGFWMAMPFLTILVLVLFVLLPYFWWRGRAQP